MGFKVYDKVDYTYGGAWTSIRKEGYTGASHKVSRYPYVNRSASGVGPGKNGSCYYYNSPWNQFRFPNPIPLLVQNRVISKFEGKCGVSGSVGSSIFAEGRESVQMAVMQLDRMASIARAMRRKDVKGLKRAWKKNKRPTTAMKQAGGKWLEFSFGWAPLVQTVFDGMAAVAADFPTTKVKAVDRVVDSTPITRAHVRYVGRAKQSMKIGYDVKVVNPNTWLLGRLDLLNPGRWIWEAIPYSFFVDYFVNIGDIIHNLDSFAGLQMTNGYTTFYHEFEEKEHYLSNWEERSSGSGKVIMRKPPTALRKALVWQSNPLTSSWRRGLNASSFLAQFLR